MWRLYAPTNRLGGVNDDGALVAPTTVKAAEDTRAPTRGAYIFFIFCHPAVLAPSALHTVDKPR